MSKQKPLTDAAGEVRELTEADFRAMRPAAEVLPPELVAVLPKRRPGQRGPGKQPAKQLVTLRIDADLVAHLKAGGDGWQTRANTMLRKALGLRTVNSSAGERDAGRIAGAPQHNKHYVKRDEGGRFKESDDVARSLSQDVRKGAKARVKPGYVDRGTYVDRGDRKRS